MRGVSQILAQERPKRAKMVQKWPKSDFEHSGAPKRLEWHGKSYRTSWLRFLHSWERSCAGGVPGVAKERPKRAKMAQKWPKSDFEHSAGGPKRLE